MASCIENIVSTGICAGEISTSGFTLMSGAGMSPANGNKIATEVYATGLNMFNAKKTLAINFLRNDFTSVLQANNIASTITEREYDSATFNTSENTGTYAGYRGQVIEGKNTGARQGLRKLKIKYIQCYPLQSGTGNLVIKDYISGVEVETVIAVEFVANTLNTFQVDYTATNHRILVLTDHTTYTFAKSTLVCTGGCSNSRENPCAKAHGFDGSDIVRQNGFGLNVIFSCACDYDILICNFAKSFTGQLLWLKWQELVYEEMYKTNRFNGWTVYNRDEIWSNIIPDLRNRYTALFNSVITGSFIGMVKQYNDNDCINCRGITTMTNV